MSISVPIPGLLPYEVSAIGRSIAGAANNAALLSILGSGTPSAANFLRGDGSWQAASTDLTPIVLGTNLVQQRNGTAGQRHQWFKTYTSDTINEGFEVDAAATDGATPVYRLGSRIGSLGGTTRGIQLGRWDASGAWSSQVDLQEASHVFSIGGIARLTISTDRILCRHNLVPSSNVIDIGLLNTPWKDLYLSGIIIANKTRVGSANYERLEIDPVGNASSFDIIAASGSGGGDNREIRIGSKYAGATSLTPWLTFGTNGSATFSGTITGRASTADAGTAPLKIATGVLMTTPEAGAIEYDGTNLYFTDSGGTRRQLQVV